MHRSILLLLLSLLLLEYRALSQNTDTTAVDILLKTIRSTREIKTISYIMTKTERIDGDMVKQITFSKISRNPLKVYLRQHYPKKGMEVLFTGGEKALINPNGFPWFNLKLSPLGNLLRENQHHTILESGYDHVINVFDHIINKYDTVIYSMISIEKDTVWDSQAVWKLRFQNPSYQIDDYTMQKGETVMQVARRDMLSEYWIVEQNKALKSFSDEKPGEIIKRPNDYAPSMELYVDKVRFIPMIMKVYDTDGLFEHYSYTDVTVNPGFKDVEFERDYHEYGF